MKTVRLLAGALALGLLACSSEEGEAVGTSEEATVESVEARVEVGRTVTKDFLGTGAQLGHGLYGAAGRAAGYDDDLVAATERSVVELAPRFVRVFFDPSALRDAESLASFRRTVALGVRAGAAVNVTYWHGPYKNPEQQMSAFADELATLLRAERAPKELYVTIQNEVNGTLCVTKELYAQLYVSLDGYLTARNARARVRFMGGDLLEGHPPRAAQDADAAQDAGAASDAKYNKCVAECGIGADACRKLVAERDTSQEAWLRDFATRDVGGGRILADLFDGYSVHIYFSYWDRERPVKRLRDVRWLVDHLPERAQKPIYVTEFGVRGVRVEDGQHLPEPGVFRDAKPARDADGALFPGGDGWSIGRTALAAFEQARFVVDAARLGYAGLVKWDAYFVPYDPSYAAHFELIAGPREGLVRRPAYVTTKMIDVAIEKHARSVVISGLDAERIPAAAFVNPSGRISAVFANDTRARQRITVGGLPPGRATRVTSWAPTDRLDTDVAFARTDASGRVVVSCPKHGVCALVVATE